MSYSPNLIIPGFPKSGTSSLFYYLTQHPYIIGSKYKEPHIYAINERFENRFNPDSKLSFPNLFSQKEKSVRYKIEASTIYMISPDAPKRIIEDSPKCKIIIIARDPIERIISHYRWLYSLGLVQQGFKKEISGWLNIPFNPNKSFKGNYKNYIDFSKYGEQLERWKQIFPAENLLLISYKDLKTNPNDLMGNIFNFLNIPHFKGDFNTRKNSTKQYIYEEINLNSLSSIKKLLPKSLKKKIKKTAKPLFYKKNTLPTVSWDEKKWVFQFLSEDIKKLEQLGISMESWETVNKIKSEA